MKVPSFIPSLKCYSASPCGLFWECFSFVVKYLPVLLDLLNLLHLLRFLGWRAAQQVLQVFEGIFKISSLIMNQWRKDFSFIIKRLTQNVSGNQTKSSPPFQLLESTFFKLSEKIMLCFGLSINENVPQIWEFGEHLNFLIDCCFSFVVVLCLFVIFSVFSSQNQQVYAAVLLVNKNDWHQIISYVQG